MNTSAYSSLFQPIPAYSSLFQVFQDFQNGQIGMGTMTWGTGGSLIYGLFIGPIQAISRNVHMYPLRKLFFERAGDF